MTHISTQPITLIMKLALLLYLAKFSIAGPFYPKPGKNCGRYPTAPKQLSRGEAEAISFARVLGGEDSTQESHPWQVYVKFSNIALK